MDVVRAVINVRMLTGTYLLQSHKKMFNLDGVTVVTCPLCCLEDENLVHMLTRCPALGSVRQRYLSDIKQCLQQTTGVEVWSKCLPGASKIVQLIIDCQKLVPVVIPDNIVLLREIEEKSRLFCYKLHMKRLYLLNNVGGSSGGVIVAGPANPLTSDYSQQ